jgi:hypothetical protein
MEILEAFDLTRCAHSAAELAGVDEKTVARDVAIRDAGRDPCDCTRRGRAIDAFLGKIEELGENSQGRIRADVVHQRLWGSRSRPVASDLDDRWAWPSGHDRELCRCVCST